MRLQLVPAQMDLELYSGDGPTLRVLITDLNGNPMNVTGTVMSQIRQNRTDAAPFLTFTNDLTNAAAGIVNISLTGAQTATMVSGTSDPWRGFWDFQWTPSGAQPLTVLQGAVTCDLDVSH
jgi:hypothetical protein